jgi:hypothetical protein
MQVAFCYLSVFQHIRCSMPLRNNKCTTNRVVQETAFSHYSTLIISDLWGICKIFRIFPSLPIPTTWNTTRTSETAKPSTELICTSATYPNISFISSAVSDLIKLSSVVIKARLRLNLRSCRASIFSSTESLVMNL